MQLVFPRRAGLCLFLLVGIALTAQAAPVADTPFVQEFHEAYPLPNGDANDVRAIAVADDGAVWAATKIGVFVLRNGAWSQETAVATGPSFDLYKHTNGDILVGAWDGIYFIRANGVEHAAGIDKPVTTIGQSPDGLVAMGPDGAWTSSDTKTWTGIKDTWSRNVRAALSDRAGNLWIATGMGLYRKNGEAQRHYFEANDIFSGDINALALDKLGRLWVGEWGGVEVFENGVRVARIQAQQGLPNAIVHSLTFAPDGTLWIGTDLGVARYSGGVKEVSLRVGTPEEHNIKYSADPDAAADYKPELWSLRHSKRWLLNDNVRDVAFDKDGNAYVATGGGVSAIKRRMMTLADKAAYFQEILETRHTREPGLVEKIYFTDLNDLTKWRPRDDDNDGEFTSQYLVMESCRYAATKDPKAKANAKRAFDALKFLQTVTGTNGFFARTVVPADWTEVNDGNETITPQMAADRRRRDPRYKQVEVRWRKSADGKWLWKGDTSSDETTGHFFGYLYYYDLVADDAEKAVVRAHVKLIMDYIIDGGYVFRDTDGQATRWAVWSPEKLLGDPDWRVETPINAWEILSYLKTTYHMTGDEKYQREYLKLMNDHNYKQFLSRPRSFGRSEWIQFDDNLLLEAAPALVLYETDPELRALILEGLSWEFRAVQYDQNLLDTLIFAGITGMEFDLEGTLFFLRDQPLDLRQWAIDNSKRDDIRPTRRPMQEPLQMNRLVPPSERGTMRWDKNPWDITNGGDFVDAEGRQESSGAFWLLPYWMGRYYGYIAPPAN